MTSGPGDLAAQAEDVHASPRAVQAALAELLIDDPALGAATALGILAREPRIKPSRSLLVDPHDAARRRWDQRVAAAAALLASPALEPVRAEFTDELAESADLARDAAAVAATQP